MRQTKAQAKSTKLDLAARRAGKENRAIAEGKAPPVPVLDPETLARREQKARNAEINKLLRAGEPVPADLLPPVPAAAEPARRAKKVREIPPESYDTTLRRRWKETVRAQAKALRGG